MDREETWFASQVFYIGRMQHATLRLRGQAKDAEVLKGRESWFSFCNKEELNAYDTYADF